MSVQRIGFPLIVAVTVVPIGANSEGLLSILRDTFKELRERSPFGILVVHSGGTGCSEEIVQSAKEAGVDYRTIKADVSAEAGKSSERELTTTDIELVETSDVLMVVSTAATDGRDPMERDIRAYAHGIGRRVIHIDVGVGALKGYVAPRSESGWLPDLFETAGLSADADLETIKSKMSAVANRAAPLTRGWWKWILLLQGLAALIPLVWLVRRPVDIPIPWVAAMAFFAVILLLSVNWWLRWRGMQKTWARARLVAELARSLLATAGSPRLPGLQILAIVPALRPLRWLAHSPVPNASFAEWRECYVRNRIDDQEKYFRAQQERAEIQRKDLSRWVTVLLDIALAFAFAGVVVAFAPESRDWIRRLGDIWLEIILGIAGTLMPLGLLLVQTLRGVQELNRRTARFAQQRQMLDQARARLESVMSAEPAIGVIEETERQLLAEVLEWYFHAETAEHFFQLHEKRSATWQSTGQTPADVRAPGLRRRLLGTTSAAGLFLLRVVLGRVPWIVGSGMAAIAWIAYHQPSDAAEKAKLVPLAKLHGTDGSAWIPDQARAEHGCVIIVHGLHGHSLWTTKKDDWMQKCGDAIEKRMGDGGAPNICLVDWQGVATPSKVYNLNLFGSETANMLQDVVAIREQAYQVGDQLGIRLALLVADGTIHKNQPCHLIGHSAGGFVVARTARILAKLNLAPSSLYVTILDTPAPDNEVLIDLPEKCHTDFYITSAWGGTTPLGLLADFSARGMHMKQEPAPTEEETALDKHRWAYTWFMKTITDPDSAPGEGFNRSPLLERKPASDH